MSTVRERVQHSIAHGDLDPEERGENGCDRIGALARSDPLGAAIWRVQATHDVHAFHEVIELLTRQIPTTAAWTPFMRALCETTFKCWLMRQLPPPGLAQIVYRHIEEADKRVVRQVAHQLGLRRALKQKD